MIFEFTNVFETGILCLGAGGCARYLSISCLRKGACRKRPGGARLRPSLGGAAIVLAMADIFNVPSIAAWARRDVFEPIFLHRFVGPEIHRYFHRIRPPHELLAELDLGPDFL